jgi:uncharacterized protein YfaS (alpha-2-macroglobulin family)
MEQRQTGRSGCPTKQALGQYRIHASLESVETRPNERYDGNAVAATFQVSAFRRPDFRVETTIAASPPILGTTLSGTVEARYLFGAALGKQSVRWYTAWRPSENLPEPIRLRFPERQFAFGYRPEGTPQRQLYRQSNQSTASLGADGKLSVSVETTSGDDFASDHPTGRRSEERRGTRRSRTGPRS